MRGRDIAGVIEQYTKFVKPAFDTFVAPSRKHADVIIPWGRSARMPHKPITHVALNLQCITWHDLFIQSVMSMLLG